MTTKHRADEIADEIDAIKNYDCINPDENDLHGWYVTEAIETAKMLRTIPALEAEIEALKEVLIKSKELLEQGEVVDFDDMMHIEILLEDACEVRELIEKTLNKGKDDDFIKSSIPCWLPDEDMLAPKKYNSSQEDEGYEDEYEDYFE